jgi:hypothetical protein
MNIAKEENHLKIISAMDNSDDIRKYLIENKGHLLSQIDLGGKNGCKTVRQLNSLFSFVFKYLDYEEIFRYLNDISLGVYIDDELDKGFEIGFFSDICNLILKYNHTDIAKKYLDDHIFWLFPYFLEIKDRDKEVRSVLLRIKRGWSPLCRDLNKEDSKALKRIFGVKKLQDI